MKTALVTGASKGIGYEVTTFLLQDGFKVYGISRTKPEFDDNHFVWLECDLLTEQSITAAIQKISEPRLDILVSNAGTALEESAVEVSIESFMAAYNLNVLAPMIIVRELVSKLPGCTIINISSVSDRLVEENYALYCSSKAASTRYFETLAKELPTSKIYSLLPDYVDTPLLRKLQVGQDFPWEKTIRPEQIAKLAHRIYKGELQIESDGNIIVINNELAETTKARERLYAYNTDSLELTRLN